MWSYWPVMTGVHLRPITRCQKGRPTSRCHLPGLSTPSAFPLPPSRLTIDLHTNTVAKLWLALVHGNDVFSVHRKHDWPKMA